MTRVLFKWNGTILEKIINSSEKGSDVKEYLNTITNVPCARQKIIGFKGGILKDNVLMSSLDIIDGMQVTLIGTPNEEKIPEKIGNITFIEDLPEHEREQLLNNIESNIMPSGLINKGSTCYLNAVIQFLRPIDQFKNYLKKIQHLSVTKLEYNICTSLKELYITLDHTNESIEPDVLMNYLRLKHPIFAEKNSTTGDYEQQDAEECLSVLMDCIIEYSEDINKLFSFQMEKKLTCLDGDEKKSDPILETFRTLSCYFGTQLSTINFLTEGIQLSLDECITMKSEELQKDLSYKQTMRLATLPNFLFVHLVRFEWKKNSSLDNTGACRTKICRKVEFPNCLDVSPFVNDSLKKKIELAKNIKFSDQYKETENTSNSSESQKYIESGEYELISVITHQGNLFFAGVSNTKMTSGRSAKSGHYVTWTKKDENIWYKFDDNIVTECEWKYIDLTGGRSDYHIAVLLLYKHKHIKTTLSELRSILNDQAHLLDTFDI